MAAGVPFIVGWPLGQDGWAISACGTNAALVTEIDDRMRFSKHFVILDMVICCYRVNQLVARFSASVH